ncbi:MAG: hypothetical protein U5N55_13810 [Cypionkella sp.]|nr:hypothetical protein [Cypionkella sp.]
MKDLATFAALRAHFGHDNLTLVDGTHVIDETSGEEFALAHLPLVYPVQHTRDRAMAQMRAKIDQFLAQFTGGVPAAEIASWPEKAALARAYLNGAPSPAIDGEAALRGISGAALAQIIAAKAGQYAAIIGMVSGLRAATEAAVAAAADDAAVAAALMAAEAQANAAAAKFGLRFA